jgi:glutamate dehydrogenase (NADP+)
MRFCQSFMTELYRHIGENTDVPAGDSGVGHARSATCSVSTSASPTSTRPAPFTGKEVDWGEAPLRFESSGYGCAYFMQEVLGP